MCLLILGVDAQKDTRSATLALEAAGDKPTNQSVAQREELAQFWADRFTHFEAEAAARLKAANRRIEEATLALSAPSPRNAVSSVFRKSSTVLQWYCYLRLPFSMLF